MSPDDRLKYSAMRFVFFLNCYDQLYDENETVQKIRKKIACQSCFNQMLADQNKYLDDELELIFHLSKLVYPEKNNKIELMNNWVEKFSEALHELPYDKNESDDVLNKFLPIARAALTHFRKLAIEKYPEFGVSI